MWAWLSLMVKDMLTAKGNIIYIQPVALKKLKYKHITVCFPAGVLDS